MATQKGREQKRGILADKVWDLAMKASVPILIILGTALIRQEIRISRIEETRFTDSDGLRLEQRLERWIEQRFPSRSDFESMREDVREIKAAIKILEKKM